MSIFTVYSLGYSEGSYGGWSSLIKEIDSEVKNCGSMKIKYPLELEIKSLINSLETIQEYRYGKHDIKLFINSSNIYSFFKNKMKIPKHTLVAPLWLRLTKTTKHFNILEVRMINENGGKALFNQAVKMAQDLKQIHS